MLLNYVLPIAKLVIHKITRLFGAFDKTSKKSLKVDLDRGIYI